MPDKSATIIHLGYYGNTPMKSDCSIRDCSSKLCNQTWDEFPDFDIVSRGQTAFFRILGGEKRVWCNSNNCLLLSRPHIPGTLIE